MGIVHRFSRVVRANLNALLSSDRPAVLIDGAIDELQQAARRAQQDRITSLGSQKRLTEESAQLRAEGQRWEARAALALRNGDEALARDALQQKLETERKATALERDAAEHGATALSLDRTIQTLETEARTLEARKPTLVADVLAARAQNLQPPELTRAQDRVHALEAEIEAANVLHDPKRAELDARFQALESKSSEETLEDELRHLKAQLAETKQE